MTEQRPPEFQLASVVATFDPRRLERNVVLGTSDIEAIEQTLGQTIRTGRATSERGGGAVFAIQRQQIDVLVIDDRFEVRSLQPTFNDEVAHNMASLFTSVIERIDSVPWLSMGYNFIILVDSEETAIAKINDRILRDDLSRTLGQHVQRVLGGGAWLWLEVEDATLWLRLEPHRNSRTTTRISVNANFEVQLPSASDFPSQRADMARSFLNYWQQLKSILGEIRL